MPEPCSIFFCTRRSNKAGGGGQAGDMVGSRRPGTPKKTPVGFQGTSPHPVGSLLHLHSCSTTAPACSPCAKSAALSPSFNFSLFSQRQRGNGTGVLGGSLGAHSPNVQPQAPISPHFLEQPGTHPALGTYSQGQEFELFCSEPQAGAGIWGLWPERRKKQGAESHPAGLVPSWGSPCLPPPDPIDPGSPSAAIWVFQEGLHALGLPAWPVMCYSVKVQCLLTQTDFPHGTWVGKENTPCFAALSRVFGWPCCEQVSHPWPGFAMV